MNKEKFLETLRKKLSILEESEIEDILIEYEGYIEEKMKEGCTEEEAVKSMGDVRELAKDLLSAYKIKPEKSPTKNEDTFNNFLDSVVKVFERICDIFSHKSFEEIIKFMVELVFIFILIGLCKIPFSIISEIGNDMIGEITYPHVLYTFLHGLWNFILELAYFIFAVLMFVKLFKKRFLEEENLETVSTKKERTKNSEKKEHIVSETKKEEHFETSRISDTLFKTLSSIGMAFVKLILFLLLIGVIFYLIGMSCVVGVSTYLLFIGVTYFGLYIIFISLFLLGILIFIFLFNIIFNHKTRTTMLLIFSLVSVILLGVGTGICALEFASTTVIYEENTNLKEKEFYYTYEPNLVLSTKNIIEDESLKDQIKVVYAYNDTYIDLDARPRLEKEGKYQVLSLSYRTNSIQYKFYFEEFIENLKQKKLVATSLDDVQIKVYASPEVSDKLIKTRISYYDD